MGRDAAVARPQVQEAPFLARFALRDARPQQLLQLSCRENEHSSSSKQPAKHKQNNWKMRIV